MAGHELSATIFMLFVFTFFFILPSISLPFVVLHGISDSCSKTKVKRFTKLLTNWSGCQGYCIEIGDGAWDSWFMPLMKQTEIACEKVKKIDELIDGYNLVGLSQGAMIGRGLIEFCDGGPQVNNFISLAGPHAGIASVPLCGSEVVCILVDYLIELEVYGAYVQEHLAPSNYIKIPTDIKSYLKGCKFLPQLNNEIKNRKNSTYKERFSSIEKLVLIMFENDTVLVPKETSLFGYYPDGSFDTVLPANETLLYTEDWIGLKTLVEAGKVEFINVTGGHLEITESIMKEYIVPYLEDEDLMQIIVRRSSIYRWFLRLWNSFMELLFGFPEDGLNDNTMKLLSTE
ncbi:hypothetical protein Nepgr_023485 [Nepenthes gracilis]|uniref:Palmitoyl-protein thioesterase 1 n=1 Tax=Nepenthes gracilis TaxID=150966 RepID=A0AAD3XXX2_NEPGR|nr:hypothetical protein Nepgr_023485 [Nepenthes gracilis]